MRAGSENYYLCGKQAENHESGSPRQMQKILEAYSRHGQEKCLPVIGKSKKFKRSATVMSLEEIYASSPKEQGFLPFYLCQDKPMTQSYKQLAPLPTGKHRSLPPLATRQDSRLVLENGKKKSARRRNRGDSCNAESRKWSKQSRSRQ